MRFRISRGLSWDRGKNPDGSRAQEGLHSLAAGRGGIFSHNRGEAAQTGINTRRASEGPAGILASRSKSPGEQNAAAIPGSGAAVETSGDMRASPGEDVGQ